MFDRGKTSVVWRMASCAASERMRGLVRDEREHGYPVGLHQVSEADEKITRKLVALLEQQPELQASVSGFPKIRAAVKG